ncbi:Uu.00g114090.m01.CDS01 [Anthostomella pinea]|uniref:Uu.00g114090.m01.CDS01 n=1 Tax=Anthostomella pinea TaxID=933095 RepID=A0AAI8VGI9_9PEZI|nr:Uu.00g114090.m01.CDS01 [Anthostomella pinea]
MTHAFLHYFVDFDIRVTKWEEVWAGNGHGSCFQTMCKAIHKTVRTWCPALAGIREMPLVDIIDLSSLVIIHDRFRPMSAYLTEDESNMMAQALTMKHYPELYHWGSLDRYQYILGVIEAAMGNLMKEYFPLAIKDSDDDDDESSGPDEDHYHSPVLTSLPIAQCPRAATCPGLLTSTTSP